MPLNDELGQSIPYPVLTDKPNAQTGFGGLVNAMTPKLILTYPSASVRGAILTAPVPGMVSWLADVKRLEVWDGIDWVAFSVGTSMWTSIPLAAGYSETGNNNQGPVQYRIINLSGVDALMIRGGVRITYNSDGSIPNGNAQQGGRFNLNLLPSSVWPAGTRTISVATSATNSTTSTAKLDVLSNGELRLVGLNDAKDSPPWVAFNVTVPL